MSAHNEGVRADKFEITDIRSRLVFDYHTASWQCDRELEDHMKPAHGDDGEVAVVCPLCDIDECEWEMYPGLYGPNTLLKEVFHYTMGCPECGSPGWHDSRGEVVCEDDECGVVISGDAPMMLPEDHFDGRCGGDGGTGIPAIMEAQPAEPDVQ
ncbi:MULTISPECIES: hypothetical protein [unclassified Halorubrum]|uniref:hypothetical protein n=1 Tax=unclassified Halorubrum TaxID=2642239 RepID=UPI00190D9105|nr:MULTISPECIES: hypothetical protein [unclassified Halorubrum]